MAQRARAVKSNGSTVSGKQFLRLGARIKGPLIPGQWKLSPAPAGAKAKICWGTGESLRPSKGWVGQVDLEPVLPAAGVWLPPLGPLGWRTQWQGSSPGDIACPELAFSHQNPQVTNLGRGGKVFPNNNRNYCCCCRHWAKHFAGISPLDLHGPSLCSGNLERFFT